MSPHKLFLVILAKDVVLNVDLIQRQTGRGQPASETLETRTKNNESTSEWTPQCRNYPREVCCSLNLSLRIHIRPHLQELEMLQIRPLFYFQYI